MCSHHLNQVIATLLFESKAIFEEVSLILERCECCLILEPILYIDHYITNLLFCRMQLLTEQPIFCLCTDKKKCNIFDGKWVESDKEPLYRNETCPFLSQGQNCPGNGRPDEGYLNWRWQPTECELPRFDGLAFLEVMRGKTLAFIGDSVTRNQFEALMCALWQVRI